VTGPSQPEFRRAVESRTPYGVFLILRVRVPFGLPPSQMRDEAIRVIAAAGSPRCEHARCCGSEWPVPFLVTKLRLHLTQEFDVCEDVVAASRLLVRDYSQNKAVIMQRGENIEIQRLGGVRGGCAWPGAG